MNWKKIALATILVCMGGSFSLLVLATSMALYGDWTIWRDDILSSSAFWCGCAGIVAITWILFGEPGNDEKVVK